MLQWCYNGVRRVLEECYLGEWGSSRRCGILLGPLQKMLRVLQLAPAVGELSLQARHGALQLLQVWNSVRVVV
jgi:hypothetical protein